MSAMKKSILSLCPLFFKEYFLPEFGQDENLLQTFAILASSVSKLGYPILPQINRRTSIIPLILPKQFHRSTSMHAKKSGIGTTCTSEIQLQIRKKLWEQGTSQIQVSHFPFVSEFREKTPSTDYQHVAAKFEKDVALSHPELAHLAKSLLPA